MMQNSDSPREEHQELEFRSTAQLAHSMFRMLLALRYRMNLVITVMGAAALIGCLYYVTATRFYASKAVLLITQSGNDQLDTSLTNNESQHQSAMPTFENMLCSAKVVEGALQNLAPSDQIDLADAPRDCWVGRLQANLSSKAIRATNILELTYRSRDPQVAANVVRATMQSYLDFMDKTQKGTAGEISRMLTKERQDLAEKLNQKQEELLACRRDFADMGFRSDGKTLHPMVQRAVYFNDALVAAQKERVEAEATLATIQAAIARNDDLTQFVAAVGDAVGREIMLSSLGLSNRDVYTQASVEHDLVTARADLQSAQHHFGPMHPEVLALTEKIRTTEEFLIASRQRLGSQMEELQKAQLGPWLVRMATQKLDESRKKEEVLQTRFEETRTEAINLSGQLAKIELLERDIKRLGDMNDVLLNQIASLNLKQNGQEVRVAVIEEPTVSKGPVSPRLTSVAILTIVGGFGLALGLVTLLDALDDRFRSVDELQSRLGLPLLSMIQQLETSESSGPQALVTHTQPMSVASESFRTLRTALTLTYPDARQIVVTSAEPGDGKTTTLTNLAVCYAQAEKRTLLIDADLRRPGLTALMEMRGPRGLSEVLRSDGNIADAASQHIRPTGIKGLDVIPSGPRPPDPAELLGSNRLSQLLSWAETIYDMILIDSPPTLATTDTAVIGRLVDGVILVVQPAKNRRRLVTRVVERLGLMKIPLLGLVVNRTGSEAERGYYGYHSYGYGYGYGYEYGTGEGYGHEEQRASEPNEDKHPRRARDPFQYQEDDEEPPTRVVPRRVA